MVAQLEGPLRVWKAERRPKEGQVSNYVHVDLRMKPTNRRCKPTMLFDLMMDLVQDSVKCQTSNT
jgi:hypothetical protein